jgi:hypothetical protein
LRRYALMHLRHLTAAVLASAMLIASAVGVVAADDARIRVLHASPDAPAVDIWLDGTRVDALTNVPFGVISNYLSVPAGDHEVKVAVTGTETFVITATVSLEAGRSYTIAAIGPVADISPKVFVDNPNPTADAAKVRVVHLSPDAPAVDVAPDGADPDDAVVKNLAYPDATEYLSLPPGTYDLEIRPTGTTDVALDLDPLALQAGRAYSVFAIGSAAAEPLGDNALQVLVAVDAVAAPATDVATANEATEMPGPAALAAILVAAAAVAFGLLRRLAVVRAR